MSANNQVIIISYKNAVVFASPGVDEVLCNTHCLRCTSDGDQSILAVALIASYLYLSTRAHPAVASHSTPILSLKGL